MARQMKDSGVEWIGEIPEDWGIHTAFQLFSQVKNKNEGMHEDNLLSLSYGRIIKKNINATEGLCRRVLKDTILLSLTILCCA